jgi:D-aspartate ligase
MPFERIGIRRGRANPAARKASAPNPPAIILGGAVTALSVARSLTDAGVPVFVLDRRDSPARVSRLRKAFVDVGREEMQPRMLHWLRSGPPGAVVLACSDEGLELIARHRAELLELGYIPMEANDEALLAMLDKERTYALASEHGIPVPRARALRNQADVDAVSRELSYPCVLKPVHSHVFARRAQSGAKVLTADTPAELRAVFERMSAIGVEMLVTEVIAGPDDEYVSSYSYLDERGEPLLHFTKRKIRQYPNRFGIGTYHATTHDPEVADVGLRFVQAVGLRGLANVEFKRDGQDGQLKLIECNARFTMPNDLIRIAGIDLALFSYNRLLGRPTPPIDSYRVGIRLWDPLNDTRAFLGYRRSGELSFRRWIGSLLHPQHFPRARLDDPLPALVRVSQGIGRVFTRAVRASPRHRSRGIYGLGKLTERIASTGPRSFALASRLDLVRSTGPGYVWRRLRAERRLSGLGEQVRHAVYERIWRDAADAAGARIEPLAPGLFELSRDDVATRVFQQMIELDDPVTLQVALDKVLVHRWLAAAGVSIPDHLEFDVHDPAPALEFLARAGGPCVVKPAAGTGGGHGTTANVTQPAELMRARLHAAKSSGRLLIERQAAGAVYRLLLLDGEVIDVLRSLPAQLTGDGQSTIEALIVAENERRVAAGGAAGLSLLGVNLDMVFALARAGLTLSSVLAAGRTVAIGVVTNNNAVEDNETFRGDLSPKLIAEARLAQDAVGLRLAGVDVITTDPARPLAETGGVINEVNGTPGLHHHYLVADPDRATHVAIPILERLLSRAAGNGAGEGPAGRTQDFPSVRRPESHAESPSG